MRNHQTSLVFAVGFGICLVSIFARGEAYDLRTVKGMEGFEGSAAAKELLGHNGFVVADPSFKQIFEAYIKSPRIERPTEKDPMGQSLPSFITTDSAWHTYHVLLEEGVKQLEENQGARLLSFSRQLLTAVRSQKTGPATSEMAIIASVGLALQNEEHRKLIGGDEKRIVEGLRTGSGLVEVPVGFGLSPLQFRAQSFYTQSPELSDYFAARQWYASVVFRLANAKETRLAVTLATLIEGNPELHTLWKQLSDPYDVFVASAEDGTIREYVKIAKLTFGGSDIVQASDKEIAQIQSVLEKRLPLPRVNDQMLSPSAYAEFAKQTRGFRLLPPRQLPCAVCFQNTVDPNVPGRMYPSGLDFMAASPVLRSPAAVRALQSQFGEKNSGLILKVDCGPMPDSLHGEAMQLLSVLQKPLPSSAAPAMRNEAWSDLQLWTQLGAWAEQRHTWALHTKISVMYMGMIEPPKGMVAPYPEFFSGLAKLTGRTAAAFEKATPEPQFELKAVATELSSLLKLEQDGSLLSDLKQMEKWAGKLEQLGQFRNKYFEKHQAEIRNDSSGKGYKKIGKELEEWVQRCAESGVANEAETESLRSFFDSRQNIGQLIKGFVPVCERLAQLAQKSLTSQALTEDDAKWIEGYGVTLAGFHFYYGNSYEVPRDDFPIVTRVFSNPLTDSTLYAGLARPQALYVIATDGKAQQLYRGAVLTYREFVRPNTEPLDDESWRELVAKGQAAAAPPFTRSFYAETSVAELLKRLRAQGEREDFDYGDIRDVLFQIGARATTKDIPELLKLLRTIQGNTQSDIREGLAEIIATHDWELQQNELIALLASEDKHLADMGALILTTRPASVDVATLIAGFDKQPPRVRRLYCAVLRQLPKQTEATRKLLLQASRDADAGVRWQAIQSMGQAGTNSPETITALLASFEDPNQAVAEEAARSLAKLGATNAGPVLFARLKTLLASTNATAHEYWQQAKAVTKDINETGHSDQILDPDGRRIILRTEMPERAREVAHLRLAPQPFDFPTHDHTIVDGLIQVLVDLKYSPATEALFGLRGGDYDREATYALAKLAPERLAKELLATAKDKQLDSYLREKALVTLGRVSASNSVQEIVVLLDDETPIIYSSTAHSRPMPGPPWKICDRAALTIGILMGWEDRMSRAYRSGEEREETMKRAREWAKSPR